MEKLIIKKLAAINDISQRSFRNESNVSIIEDFTQESVDVLNADFGFAWGRQGSSNDYTLLYKSPSTPYNPSIPKKSRKGINSFKKKGEILFDEKVKKENYEGNFGKYVKSYILIPIRYGDHVYGTIVICYREHHSFSDEDFVLVETIAGAIARIVTINWLIEKERTALKIVEKQKETEVLLAQEKLKTEFISNATHELRTPLAIMKGNVELALLSKSEIKAQKAALELVNEEINILSGVLKDLTLLTSVGKNAREVMGTSQVRVMDLVNNIAKRLKVVAAAKKIKIITKGDKTVKISGDKNYLEKLFLNLIKNAITYGREDGYIEVDIKKQINTVIIKVSDNGIGMSKEDLPKIFERFYRADKSHSSSGNHTGLGLAIAKWVAETHGGDIEVRSILGKGSTFLVTLPAKASK